MTTHFNLPFLGGRLCAPLISLCLLIALLSSSALAAATPPSDYAETHIAAGTAGKLVLEDASLLLPAGAVREDRIVSVTQLAATAVPQLNQEIFNLIPDRRAYRFGPSGSTFPIALTLELPYDPCLLPGGSRPEQIAIFYYQPEADRWTQLMPDTILLDQNRIRVKIKHFTDFITGIIKVPESPETQGYQPTEIKDIKAANPSAGITMIELPEASQRGGANLSYPIKLPGGRNGLQPQLTLQYNNQGGHSWVGLGWSLDIPSIGIETQWGVPRYLGDLESETYTYQGEQLWPVAHREAFKSRSGGDKQFWPRVENSFARIIRHGNSPKDYWWEVTEKNGTRHFFGRYTNGSRTNLNLRDENNNIGKWLLAETRDANDNFIRYHYRQGSKDATAYTAQLYPDYITYSGHGEATGKYRINFTTDAQLGQSLRPDKDLSGRLGFLLFQSERLREIEITFRGETVRSCELEYSEGAFFKTLLSKIIEKDAEGDFFFQHEFDYYDEVRTGGNEYAAFDALRSTEMPNDGLQADLSPLIDLSPYSRNGSAIGSTTSSTLSVGGAVTVGPPGNIACNCNTVGGNYSLSRSSGSGLNSLIDLNGDGLPDKLFRENGKLRYRTNLGVDENLKLVFASDWEEITEFDDFSFSRTRSNTKGFQASINPLSIAYSNAKTTTTTSVYPGDFNADGVTDFAVSQRAYFGYIDPTGQLRYSLFADDTVNPIKDGASISEQILTDAAADRDALIDEYPLHDLVRVWVAPFDGTVRLTGNISYSPLVDDDYAEYPTDGVVAKVQYHNVNEWSSPIIDRQNRETEYDLLIDVKAGRRIYFRLQSIEDGAYDQVIWNPHIDYLEVEGESVSGQTRRDPNGLDLYHYKFSEDYHTFCPQSINVPLSGEITIAGTFEKEVVTDTVRLEIVQRDAGTDTVVTKWTKTLLPGEVYSGILDSISWTVKEENRITFTAFSGSRIDWRKISWRPKIFYTSVSGVDAILVDPETGNPAIQFTPAVNAPLYGANHQIGEPIVIQDTVTASLFLQNTSLDPEFIRPKYSKDQVNLRLVLRGPNNRQVASKGLVTFIQAPLFAFSFTVLPPKIDWGQTLYPGDTIYAELYADDYEVAEELMNRYRIVLDLNGDVTNLSQRAGIYSPIFAEEEGFGPRHRGWGRFVYNGNRDRANEPIVQDELKFDPEEINTDEDADIEGMETQQDLENAYDPVSAPLVIMTVDATLDRWIGADNLTFITQDTVSSSRFGLDNISPETFSSTFSVPNRKTKSSTETGSTGVGLSTQIPGLSGNIGANASSGNLFNLLEYVDLSGDQYPDAVGPGLIQFSLPTGGLEGQERSSPIGVHRAKSFSAGATIGGSQQTASFSTSSGGVGKQVFKALRKLDVAGKDAAKRAALSPSVNGGVSKNDDWVRSTWRDINGDGLLDYVSIPDPDAIDNPYPPLYLSQGYSVVQPVDWGIEKIQEGSAVGTNFGAGIGGSFCKAAISFGLTFNETVSRTKHSLADMNGDGLTDLVRFDESSNTIKVKFNKGTEFATTEIDWISGVTLDENIGTGQAINASFTFCIPLFFIRICLSPQGSKGKSVSRQRTQFTDINGDGYPDYLLSEDGDHDLRYRLSKIGRTNQLKTIYRPLGGTITLDYERVGNTYAQPNSIWALSEAEVHDGLADDGADVMRYQYQYEEGFKDRRERQFYGFARVTTEELDTENDNAVYRRRVVEYANDTYYRKGLKLAETTYDADSAIYARMTYEYALRDVQTGDALPAAYTADDGLAFPAKVAETTFFHEGRETAPLQRRITYYYDTYGNIVRYRDAGDGSSADWVSAEIDYHELTDPYIVGAPRRIEVTTNSGRLRAREADIDNRGNVTQIRAYLGNGDAAIHDLEYDAYGNLTRLIRPANYQGERMFHAYEYDPAVQTYVTRVTDAYGYSSSATYDYRFGERLSTTDINEQEIRYTLDAKGRMATVTGPYELASGVPYTIAMDYHPEAAVPYARTRHYEPEHPADPIETYTFMDGLQRPVQVKKTGFVSDTPDQPGSVRMIVSGRVVFDAFGRTVASYHPTVEAEGNEMTFSTAFDTVDPTRKTYDVLDRETSITLPDGATTTKVYDIAPNDAGAVCLYTSTVDPLGNRKDAYLDVRERQCANVDFGPNGPIWTTFAYNPIGELLTVTDAGDHVSSYTYDQLGRKTEFFHPDAGLTTFAYDLSNNQLRKQTAEIRASLGDDAYIRYDYEFQRPTRIAYPRNYQNNVRLHYGAPGAEHNRAGRVWLREDASGGVETFYGPLGETVKTIRTVVVNPTAVLTYISESEYDTWNRIKRMTYPDGEVVTYRYNRAGKLAEMTGRLGDVVDDYVEELRYDKFEQRLLLVYGNDTHTEYSYEPERRRLQTLRATSDTDGPFIAMDYTYDAVDNITAISNSIELIGAGQLGGSYAQEYRYDELYRLTEAKGEWSRGGLSSSYELSMNYDNLHNITEKTQRHERNGFEQTGTTYDHAYQYEIDRPHVPTSIGAIEYNYDANGNLTSVSDGRGLVSKQLIWDEENRLQGHTDNGYLSQYTYDADGERVIKSHGGVQAVFFAGVEAGFINHTENFTVYVSPYLVARAEGFSKHYFIGTQRIASRLGTGKFANNAINGQQGVTAGQLDYLERARLVRQAARQFIDPTDSLPPGHPADPDRPIVPLPDIFVASADYTVPPPAWQSALPFGPPAIGAPPGHPIWRDSSVVRDSVGAGYGWIDDIIAVTPSLFYYHPDHLGSTAYITDINGRVSQHLVYMPFGETFVEEFNFTSALAAQPYLFNGKELDRETGFYYYGARYYDPATSVWLSLDPLMEKYPGWSPYNYTLLNPVKFVDPDGRLAQVAFGALVGGIAGGIGGAVFTEGSWEEKARGALIGAGAGAIGGAVAGAVGPALVAMGARSIIANAATSVVSSLAQTGIQAMAEKSLMGKTDINLQGAMSGAILDMFTGGFAGKLGSIIGSKMKIDTKGIFHQSRLDAFSTGEGSFRANQYGRQMFDTARKSKMKAGEHLGEYLISPLFGEGTQSLKNEANKFFKE